MDRYKELILKAAAISCLRSAFQQSAAAAAGTQTSDEDSNSHTHSNDLRFVLILPHGRILHIMQIFSNLTHRTLPQVAFPICNNHSLNFIPHGVAVSSIST